MLFLYCSPHFPETGLTGLDWLTSKLWGSACLTPNPVLGSQMCIIALDFYMAAGHLTQVFMLEQWTPHQPSYLPKWAWLIWLMRRLLARMEELSPIFSN